MATGSLFPLPAEALVPLRAYLVGQLAPISDADSSLLSDYTVALLKAAEASDAEVEDEVKTQLRDFLDHNTDTFVSTLFEALRDRSYMPAADPSAVTRKRSRSPSMTRSPPKAPRLQPPGADLRAQAAPFHPLPPMPSGSGGPSDPSAAGARPPQASNGRPPKPCFEYHQRGFCSKGPNCTFDHDPTYQGYIPPPFEVARQLSMAGMGDHVDYGSIWQGRGPMQFGGMPGMGMGGFGLPPGMGGPPPPFGAFGPPQEGGGPPGGGPRGPPPGWQQGGFRPPHGMMPPQGPPMMMGGGPRQNNNGGGRGGQRGGFPTDASTQPPKNRNGKTLVIMQIPAGSLATPAIQDYFAKFGTVTSVAVDAPSARALVSFASNEEAYEAWKSEDAVFGSRFVKVLWHRPMEGQGAKGLEALEKGKVGAADGQDAAMADGSTAAAAAAPALTKAEILAKQRLLESQIAQQKVLMARLSAPDLPADDKPKLMAQFAKLSDEMKAGTGSLALATPSTATATNAAGNRTATFASAPQDELAKDGAAMEGVEAGAGETPEISQTEMLQRKLEVLKAEAALIGVDPNAPSSPGPSTPYNPAARGPRGRGRGRGAPRGAFRGGYNASYAAPAAGSAHKSMSLDFRTKSLAIAGDGLLGDHEAVGAVERWFETIGGVDNSKVEDSANRIIVTFKSRPLAEKALARGNNITDLSIPTSITWFNAPPPSAPPVVPLAPAAAAPADEERNLSRDWDADDEEDGQRRR